MRRKFATELKHVPLKDLCLLGGWKEPQTVLKCYQRPDECTMRDAMEQRGRLLATGLVEPNRHRESTPRFLTAKRILHGAATLGGMDTCL